MGPAPLVTAPRPVYVHNATVLEVIDGDSLDVRLDLGRYGTVTIDPVVPLRLAHVDAPDVRYFLGRTPQQLLDQHTAKVAATAYARAQWPPGTRCVVRTLKAEKYGRTLAEVHVEGLGDLAALLVLAGHAVPYEGGPRA